MISGKLIFAALLLSIFSAVPLGPLEKRNMHGAAKLLMVAAVAASVYCILADVHLSSSWQDPFASATAEEVSRASVSGWGRGGILVLAMRYWPWVLIGIGAYFGYYQVQIARARWRQAK